MRSIKFPFICVICIAALLNLEGCGTNAANFSTAGSNVAPVANAGLNQNVNIGEQVILDGSGSNDANGDLLSYNWTMITKPIGSNAVLSNPTEAKTSFTADLAGTYVFNLLVNDGKVDSLTASVSVFASDGGTIPTNLTNIYLVNFESVALGTYSRNLLILDWGNTLISVNGIDEGRVSVIEDNGNRKIRVKYPAGSCGPTNANGCSNGGGAQWLMPLTRSYDELYLSYKIKFTEGFNFVLGGKLPGLTGSPSPNIMPPTGGIKPGTCDGFSARLMWKADGQMITYLYSPTQLGTYGDELPWLTPEGANVRLVAGRWYQITEHLVMNTPGVADGTLEVWLDGVKVQRKNNLFYRGTDCQQLGTNQFYFSTFFGGDTPSWAAVKDEYVLFDEFIISHP